MSTPVIYLAFANDKEHLLSSLEEEEKKIRELLAPREKERHFVVEHDSFATREVITDRLGDFQNDLVVFHYSGHADEKGFETAGEKTLSAGIATLLGKCPKLRLVVLNGCSTHDQVELLHQNGVKVVIATAAPVNDNSASAFGKALFRALADGKTFRQAFDTALGAAQTVNDSITESRSFKVRPEDRETAGPLWGIFGEEDDLQKTLPAAPAAPAEDFKPNQKILPAMIDAVHDYVEAIQKLKAEEQNPNFPVDNTTAKRREMIASLPFPLSEPLRSLLAEPSDEDEFVYYKFSPDRLRLLLTLFDNFMETVSFVAIATLWDAVSGTNDKKLKAIPAEEKKRIDTFLNLPSGKRKAEHFLPLLDGILSLLASEKVPCLMEELPAQKNLFQAESPVAKAVESLSNIKQKGDPAALDAAQVNFDCIEAEKQLATLLEPFGFLARYKMISVKSIDVFKNRSNPVAAYIHNVLRMVTGGANPDQPLRFNDGFYETKSVLLVLKESLKESPIQPVTQFLNLTPFIIDEHAFVPDNSTQARLAFFDHRKDDKKDYLYREIIPLPEDELLSVAQKVQLAETEKNEFRFLNTQFELFAQSFIPSTPNA